MNLRSGYPFWLMKSGVVNSYNSLCKNITTDVTIIGAGISGALSAHYQSDTGMKMVIVDKRHAGTGSTAASTAFLQYEIDTPLSKLIKYVGEQNAVRSYHLCREAIYEMQKICAKISPAVDFSIKPSLQYASFKKHVNDLYDEYKVRSKNGFSVHWLDEKEIKSKYNFAAPAAILSRDAGEVDAYLLTHYLLASLHRKGHKIYNNTEIIDISHTKDHIKLTTSDGFHIKSRFLIIACGYESLKYVPKKIADIHSTYAIISEPMEFTRFWYKNSLVWETADPYLYFRIADNNRILIGGRDDDFHDPNISNSRIQQKAQSLKHAFEQKLKHLQVKIDFSWAGAFAVTKDGLPYIGSIPANPNTYFNLGFGGNGITFSIIGAQLIKDMIFKKRNDDIKLFGFNR